MKFHHALNVAHQIHWDTNNTFEVFFNFNPQMLKPDNYKGPSSLKTYDDDVNAGNVLAWQPKDNERLSLHINSINLPSLQTSMLSSFAGARWSHINGQHSEYKFKMEFRDSNQMEFYRLFATQFREQSYRYFDDCCFNVFISKDSEYGDMYHNDDTGKKKFSWNSSPLISLKRCLVESVEQINFNHSSPQLLTFSVNFVANDIELYDNGARQFYYIKNNIPEYMLVNTTYTTNINTTGNAVSNVISGIGSVLGQQGTLSNGTVSSSNGTITITTNRINEQEKIDYLSTIYKDLMKVYQVNEQVTQNINKSDEQKNNDGQTPNVNSNPSTPEQSTDQKENASGNSDNSRQTANQTKQGT